VLTAETKQRLPVPEPRERRAKTRDGYRRSNAPKQNVGYQEDCADHRQGEEGQSPYGEAVGRRERLLLGMLTPQQAMVGRRCDE
jgi:hypothetical protein